MRDSRFRFLTTWTSAYINTAGVDYNIGIYGVEGRYEYFLGILLCLCHHSLPYPANRALRPSLFFCRMRS